MDRESTRLRPRPYSSRKGALYLRKLNRFLQRWGVLGKARTQILLWYLPLMACSAVITIVAIREKLTDRLEQEVQRSLVQEVAKFRQLSVGRDPATGKPFGDNVEAVLKAFLNSTIPDEGQFFITLSNGQFYRSSPRAVLGDLHKNSALMSRLAQLTRPQQGQLIISPNEALIYIAEPLVKGSNRGVLVLAYSIAREHREVDDVVIVVTEVTIGVLVFASLLAWIAAGRVLAPLQLLAKAARSVSESDLTQRLPVQGNGELARLALTFNQMMDRLQAAFDSQRNFLNDAGHELRTPITIVRGHLELMGDDPEEQRATVELVLDEIDRMSRLVSDLVLLAKAERPDFLQFETVDLSTFTEELFTKITALGDRNWQLDALGQGQVVVDRQRLTQALTNLAQNATQYTEITDTIAFGSSLGENLVRLWLRDTGKGIAPEDQKRIFQRFARGLNSRSVEGTGLGLAIVQAIIEAHNGRVELYSQLDMGATFTIIIPLKPA